MRQTVTLGAAVAFAAALLAATPASADSPAAGEYRGTMDDRGRPVAVALSLEAGPMPGGPGGRIRFSQPWMCGFELEYSGQQDNAAIYSFRGFGAGACYRYTQGYARVIQPGGDRLYLELFDEKMDGLNKVGLWAVRP
ncbi:MAG: hypothetical protein H3C38_09795 [Rhodospirillales bacterium]|nr:hypothetical protein [Rhodospirillales bacterium]